MGSVETGAKPAAASTPVAIALASDAADPQQPGKRKAESDLAAEPPATAAAAAAEPAAEPAAAAKQAPQSKRQKKAAASAATKAASNEADLPLEDADLATLHGSTAFLVSSLERREAAAARRAAALLQPHLPPGASLRSVRLATGGAALLLCSPPLAPAAALSAARAVLDATPPQSELVRLLPVQNVCALTAASLTAAAEALAAPALSESAAEADQAFSFAVSHHSRGLDRVAGEKPLARVDAVRAAAAGVEAACAAAGRAAKVNLSAPAHGLLIEVLPVATAGGAAAVALVSMLPASMLVSKPRLTVRSLAL
jgi:hypothetical protein